MTIHQRFYLTLADLVLTIHFMFVAFIAVGLLLIWLGWLCRWNFVRNAWFRLTHLAAIGMVAAESLIGFVCPLTILEDWLRSLAGDEQRYQESFIQHWLHRLMFFDVDERVFTMSYLAFFIAVVLSLWLVKPRWPQRVSIKRN
jgi:hypothetical protein